jgi:hypothetical protein
MESVLSAIMKINGEQISSENLREALSQATVSDELTALFEAYAKDPFVPLEDSVSYPAWQFYGDLCRAYWRIRNTNWQEDTFFSKEYFLEGTFTENLVTKFVAEASKSPAVPFRIEHVAPGYHFNSSSVVPLVEKYNRIFVFRALSPAATDLLQQCLAQIQSVVTHCLGSSWRVTQARFWEAKPGGEGVGTNSWHTDGYPLDAVKILSFFSDVDETKGTTQFRKVDGTIHTCRGPAGRWILFRNSVLPHSGLPPTVGKGNRLAAEITLGPSLVPDVYPVFAGVNGQFPYFPWQHLMPGNVEVIEKASAHRI